MRRSNFRNCSGEYIVMRWVMSLKVDENDDIPEKYAAPLTS